MDRHHSGCIHRLVLNLHASHVYQGLPSHPQ